MDASEAHQNATMSFLLPGKLLLLNALLALRKFRDSGNKVGAVRGFETLQESNLGRLITLKPQRGATMVNCNTYVLIELVPIRSVMDVSLGSLMSG